MNPSQGAGHKYFLVSSGPVRIGVEEDVFLGEKASENKRESEDAGNDPPADFSTGPHFNLEKQVAQGHQDVTKKDTIRVH
jgi:hypothetical protein